MSKTPRDMVLALAEQGHTDESIAVLVGQTLGVTNPSSQAIRRWRLGKGTPSRTFKEALVKVYIDTFGGA
jgi:hypothetical protein